MNGRSAWALRWLTVVLTALTAGESARASGDDKDKPLTAEERSTLEKEYKRLVEAVGRRRRPWGPSAFGVRAEGGRDAPRAPARSVGRPGNSS